MSVGPVTPGLFATASWAEGGVVVRRAGTVLRAVSALPARRILQIALGLVWLLDAALQYQPFMFSRSFVTGIIEPTAAGNPAVVAHPLTWAAHLMLHHIAVYNAFFATIQLLLAIGIFYGPTVRLALAASIGWAVFVWWFGEGLGGVLTGSTPVVGAPGAVILYAVVAVLVWPTRRLPVAPDDPSRGLGRWEAEPTAFGGLIGRRGALLVWLALWGSFAWYVLQPGNRSPSAIGAAVVGMADGEPGWVRGVVKGLGQSLAHHGTEVSLVLASAFVLVALGPWFGRTRRPALVVAGLLGAAIWVAEAFGGIFSGRGTDPNSGLLLVLLVGCYWPVRTARVGSRPRHLGGVNRSADAA